MLYSNAKKHRGASLILLGYLVLACFYALKTPIFLKPDEARHFDYVRYLKTYHVLPIVSSAYTGIDGRPHYETQGHQPPFYYVLMALVTLRDDMSDTQELYRPNPHYLSTEYGNKNPFTPGRSKSEMSFYAGRFVSLLFGAVAIVVVYLMVREFAPRVALIAMAIMAFNPQFLFISTSFSNDASIIALITIGLWQAVRILKSGFTGRRAALLGITIGFATLSKLSGLLLFMVIPFTVMWRILEGRYLEGELGKAALSLALSLSIPFPWFWRNYELYGDPLAQNALLLIMLPRELPLNLPVDLGRLLRFAWKAYWLDFSPGGIFFADGWVYLVLALFAGWGFIGALIASVRKGDLRAYLGLCTLWVITVLLAILALIIRFDFFVESGRWLLPASPAFAIMLALGIGETIPDRLTRVLTPLLPAIWGCFAVFALVFYLLPEYASPSTYPSEKDLEVPNPTFISLEDKVAVLGYTVDKLEARAGDEVKVTIYWEALEAMDENYSVFVQLLGRDSLRIAQLDTYPAMGIYPTSRWRKSQVVRDSYLVRVPQALSMPIRCQIVAGMYDFSTRDRLKAFDAQGNTLDSIALGYIVLRPTTPLEVPSEAKLSLPIEFGGKIGLVGRAVQKADYSLKLILWWRSYVEVGKDYTVFVHLCEEDGGIAAQGDSPPMRNGFPTSLWKEGDMVRDEHIIELPSDLAEGTYFIAVGLYDPGTMERLPAFESGQHLLKDAFIIPGIAF